METLAPLLHAFYTQPLSANERAEIHRTLLSSLTDASHHKAAITYVTDVTNNAQPIDPYVLHHALHTLETLARTSFSLISPSDLDSLQTLLLSFITNANMRHLSDASSTTRVPPHALNKAAAALVALGKRQWLAGYPNFPNALLRLVDSPAHTPRSLASLLAGHAILTTLLDDTLSPRRDLCAQDAARLRRLVSSHAGHFLSALEVAQRAAGPNFPAYVAPSAARAVATLCRIEPSVASHACAILARSATNRYDEVASQILTSVADILSMPAAVTCAPITDSVVSLLETLATGSAPADHVAPPLLAVVDVLVTRLVSTQPSQRIDALLNALMGVTVRWAEHHPPWLPRALDTWTSVLEAFDDADLRDERLLQRVYASVATLCAERAFYASNAAVLGSLRTLSERGAARRADLREWDSSAEAMAEVAENPFGPAAAALFFDHADGDIVRDDDGDIDDDDSDGWDVVSAPAYSAKCVEALAFLAQMSPVQARDAARVAVHALAQVTDTKPTSLADLYTALSLAYALAGVLPQQDSDAHALVNAVYGAVAAGAWRTGRAGVMAFRAAAALTPSLPQDGNINSVDALSQESVRLAHTLLTAVKEALSWDQCSDRLATAAALLSVSLDSIARVQLFGDSPPLDMMVVANSPFVGVAELGVASLTRWTVVPERDARGLRTRWDDSQWALREQKLSQACGTIFAPLGRVAVMGDAAASPNCLATLAQQAAMLHTFVLAVHGVHGRTIDAVWRAGAKTAVGHVVSLVRLLTGIVVRARLDDDGRRAVAHVIATALRSVAAVASVCGRCASVDGISLTADAVQAALPMAGASSLGGLRVAHAAMRLVRDRLAAGDAVLLVAGVDLAATTLNSATDDDVCEVAVSLLSEGLKRHWKLFWPGDVAVPSSNSNGGNTALPAASIQADPETQHVFFKALGGLVNGLRSRQLAVCRATLLALQQLNASRRLYTRDEAFRRTGAGRAVVAECLRILGGGGDSTRESLADEAVEVLWGIARVDVAGFANSLGDVVREIAANALHADSVSRIVKLFEGVDDHGSFKRAGLAAANDMIFCSKLQPSLS